jgi:hypothetical protein
MDVALLVAFQKNRNFTAGISKLAPDRGKN